MAKGHNLIIEKNACLSVEASGRSSRVPQNQPRTFHSISDRLPLHKNDNIVCTSVHNRNE